MTGDEKYRVYNSFNQLAEIRDGSTVNGVLLENYVYYPAEERTYFKQVYEAGTIIENTTYTPFGEIVSGGSTSRKSG